MKKNDYLLLTGTLAYSLLFYQQSAGLNFLLFNLTILSLFIIRNVQLIYSRTWLLGALFCLISSAAVLWHGNTLAITANVISLLVLSALTIDERTSVIFSLLFSVYSIVGAGAHMLIDFFNRNATQKEQTLVKRSYMFYTWVIVIAFTVLFFVIYRQSNPLFAANTNWINLNFISWQWLLFTTGGLFCVYGLLYHKRIKNLDDWEMQLPLKPENGPDESLMRFEMEQKAGLMLFVMLNLMLLVLNAGDMSTIWFNGRMPQGISHSDFVHDGIGLLILSVVIAVSLVMYLFRYNFTAIKNSKPVKTLVYVWALQNIMMLVSSVIRNKWYIMEYCLTYKRIGVYVWLALAALGLCILVYTIYKNKSNWFLIKSNLLAWQMALVFSSVVGWDRVITQYNLNQRNNSTVDYFYLIALSDSNIPELLNLIQDPDFETLNNAATKSYQRYYARSYQQDYRELVANKVKKYMNEHNYDWRSYTFKDERILKGIQSFKTTK